MIYVLLALNFSLMILVPILLARFISRRLNPGWGLFGMGAVTFILSQVGHIPFNWLILQRWSLLPTELDQLGNLVIYALFLGLSAGVFEECARYLTYRYWAKDARTWAKGVMLGIGHGGIEAIILGVLGLINFSVMAAMRNGMLLNTVPPDLLPEAEAQIEAFFNTPLTLIPLGFLERVFAITAHLAMSLMVMQVFTRGQRRWLGFAIGFHTLLNATAVIAIVLWNPYVTELLLGLLAVLAAVIIYRLYAPEPVPAPPAPLPELLNVTSLQMDTTAESLEKSRYS